MEKKYELTDIKIKVFGKTLFRIKALRDIKRFYVKKGDLGGYIEKEKNLGHDGDAWVYGNARVYDDAEVFGNAWVCDNAMVYGNARVCGDAWVCDNARVYDNARVCGDAEIMWLSKIGSRLGTTTAFRRKDGNIGIKCGCFEGSLDEFAAKVVETHGDNKYGREYKAAIELIKIHFGEEK